MSSRPNFGPFQSIDNGDMSANISGAVTVIKATSMVGYSFSWSGTSPVGTISIQVSNDYEVANNGSVLNSGTWNILPLEYGGTVVTAIPLSGNTGTGFIDIGALSGYAIQPIYTFTSGTGTLQAVATGKVT